MSYFVDLFTSAFKFLVDFDFAGMPILIWLVLPTVLMAVINFIRGRK